MIGTAGTGYSRVADVVTHDMMAKVASAHHHGGPLACPLCGAVRNPRPVRKDGSVTYSCPPDHVNHGMRYTWRIDVDGNLID